MTPAHYRLGPHDVVFGHDALQNLSSPTPSPKPAKFHTVKATSVSFDDGTDAQAFLPDTELVVASAVPLTDAQWDRLDEAVNAADGGFEKVEAEVAATGGVRRKILLGT